MTFQESIYRVVKKIPKGKVLTYKQVAEKIGKPGAYRAVGNALNKNRNKDVPCHRVIRSDGKIGGYAWGNKKKKEILKREGYPASDVPHTKPYSLTKNPKRLKG